MRNTCVGVVNFAKSIPQLTAQLQTTNGPLNQTCQHKSNRDNAYHLYGVITNINTIQDIQTYTLRVECGVKLQGRHTQIVR